MIYDYNGKSSAVDFLDGSFFTGNGTSMYPDQLSGGWLYGKGDCLFTLSEDHAKALENKETFRKAVHPVTPSPDSVLWYHPACTIPRSLCDRVWKRASSMAKADIIVIPEAEENYQTSGCAVFRKGNQIYILVRASKLGDDGPSVGMTFGELFDKWVSRIREVNLTSSNNMAVVESARSAVCEFTGTIVKMGRKSAYMIDVLDGIYPKVAFEKDVCALTNTDASPMTMEDITSYIEMLSASNSESRMHGLRTLAGSEYTLYPAITRYILLATRRHWINMKSKFPTTVSFMIDKYLSLNNWELEDGALRNVRHNEAPLAEKLADKMIREDLTMSVDRWKDRFPNMRITVNFDTSTQCVKYADEEDDGKKTV